MSQASAIPPSTNSFGRRAFLAGASALVAGAALGRDYGPNAQPIHYPDPDIVVLDEKFAKYKIGNTAIQRLHTGTLWAEGPCWHAGGKFLAWSDIPNDVQMRWLDDDAHVSVFRRPSNNSNGNTFDFEGRMVSCEHGARRVVRYEHDNSVTVLADKWEGKPFNAPNDIVVHPDGGIWFSDPGYGSMMNYEGHKGALEIREAVYRIDPKNAKIEKVYDELDKPNGLCFSPDYKKLYICDTGTKRIDDIRVFDVSPDNKLSNGKQFGTMKIKCKGSSPNAKADLINNETVYFQRGLADGIRADTDGNIWAGSGWVGEGYDGVHIFSPEGQRIGMILLPEICSNVCFGGAKRNRLFMTASQSLYAVYVEAQGAHVC
ncbi:MAG TPA: SMP-30/gluconolactonase/LRE family protein [Planctomycetota bacterium]|nr:SMP-30/gluconolactonase/LRE family protein [Planctomycetota bacterium]